VLNTEKEIGQNWETQYRNFASPEAAVALLRSLYERRGLSDSSQHLLLKFMTESTPGAKRLKGLLPAGAVVAHKTGTSGAQKGITAATNDIGIITLPNGKHLAIAVFVSDSPADEATREGVIAEIARAVWDKFAAE
jgi:beta-lactamase class A